MEVVVVQHDAGKNRVTGDLPVSCFILHPVDAAVFILTDER
jgi:hypothetical protein